MGMFDTIHTGRRCGQSKALGKMLRDLRPGDSVVVEAVYMPGEEYGERPEITDFQVRMDGGGFVVVRGGLIVDWVGQRDAELPAYDGYGYPLEASNHDYEGWREHWSERAARLEEGIETPAELAANRVFGEPNLTELESAGNVDAIVERRERMAEKAREYRAIADGQPHDCQVCNAL